jgi:hypothetical protein
MIMEIIAVTIENEQIKAIKRATKRERQQVTSNPTEEEEGRCVSVIVIVLSKIGLRRGKEINGPVITVTICPNLIENCVFNS